MNDLRDVQYSRKGFKITTTRRSRS